MCTICESLYVCLFLPCVCVCVDIIKCIYTYWNLFKCALLVPLLISDLRSFLTA